MTALLPLPLGGCRHATSLSTNAAKRRIARYDFALLEDFDHLYRYANLHQLIEGKRADRVRDALTEIMSGGPTIFEHRDPRDAQDFDKQFAGDAVMAHTPDVENTGPARRAGPVQDGASPHWSLAALRPPRP